MFISKHTFFAPPEMSLRVSGQLVTHYTAHCVGAGEPNRKPDPPYVLKGEQYTGRSGNTALYLSCAYWLLENAVFNLNLTKKTGSMPNKIGYIFSQCQ